MIREVRKHQLGGSPAEKKGRTVSNVKPHVLLVAAKWWPLSTRMAIALLQNGCVVSAICPKPHLLSLVDGISNLYPYASIDSLASLHHAVVSANPDFIVPCDDGAAGQCRELHDFDSGLTALIERSLGSPQSFGILESRYRFLGVSRDLGLRIPRTQKVVQKQDLIDWQRTAGEKSVVKVDGDSGGNGVRICESLDDSLAAWKTLRRSPNRLAAWKRILVDKDPLALWLRRQRREVTVQEFIDGRPANSMVLSWQGQMLALVSVVVVAADGPTGAATVVRVIDDARMEEAARTLSAHLQLSGFFGLDFVIERATGLPYLIEINPRCTQLGHLEATDGGSLGAALAAVLRGAGRREGEPAPVGTRIALFPQAVAAGPVLKPVVDASVLDVPVNAPELIEEMTKGLWPARQWIWRIYHAFNRTRLQAPMVYEEYAPPAAKAEPMAAPLLSAQS
jgi:ATP-grasp domain